MIEKKNPEKPPEEFDENEEADEGRLLQQQNEKSAALEDFKEQNLIWT